MITIVFLWLALYLSVIFVITRKSQNLKYYFRGGLVAGILWLMFFTWAADFFLDSGRQIANLQLILFGIFFLSSQVLMPIIFKNFATRKVGGAVAILTFLVALLAVTVFLPSGVKDDLPIVMKVSSDFQRSSDKHAEINDAVVMKTYGEFAFDSLKKEEVLNSILRVYPEFHAEEMATSFPSKVVEIGEERTKFLIISGCTAHDCGGSQIIVAINLQNLEASLLKENHQGELFFYGKSNSQILNLLLDYYYPHTATQNSVMDYLQGAEIQYETDQQRETLVSAMGDALSLSAEQLKTKKYRDFLGKENQWDLPTLINKYFVPNQAEKTLGNNFYHDLKTKEAQTEIKNILAKLN